MNVADQTPPQVFQPKLMQWGIPFSLSAYIYGMTLGGWVGVALSSFSHQIFDTNFLWPEMFPVALSSIANAVFALPWLLPLLFVAAFIPFLFLIWLMLKLELRSKLQAAAVGGVLMTTCSLVLQATVEDSVTGVFQKTGHILAYAAGGVVCALVYRWKLISKFPALDGVK